MSWLAVDGRNAVLSVGVRGGTVALNLAVAIVLARLLGPSEFGLFSFILAIVLLLSIPNATAVNILLIRELATAPLRGAFGSARAVTLWGLKWALVSSTALAALVAVLGVAFNLVPDERHVMLAYLLVLVPMTALLSVTGAILRGLNHVIAGQVPEQLLVPAALLLSVGAALILPGQATWSADRALMLYALACLLALFVNGLLLGRLLPKAMLRSGPSEAPVGIASITPLLLYGSLRYATAELGIILVAALAGSADAGLYRVASRGAELVVFALMGLSMSIAPRLAEMHAAGALARLRRIVGLATLASGLWGIVTAVLLILLGPSLLSLLFGPHYLPAYMALAILSIAQLFNAATGPMGVLLNMAGREKASAAGYGAALLAGLAAGALLIPPWGVNGAAVASGLSIIVSSAIFAFAALPVLGLGRGRGSPPDARSGGNRKPADEQDEFPSSP